MARTVIVGGVQLERTFGDRGYNLEHGSELVRCAADRGATIIALPELFTTGYFPGTGRVDDSYFDWAEPIPGPTTDALGKLAHELTITIIAPIFEIDPLHQLFFNSAAIVGPQGLMGRYRKRHVPSTANAFEKHYFSTGDLGYPVFSTDELRFGVSICYDRHFPETYRHLALGGAELVFSVNNTGSPRSKRMWAPEIQVASSSNGIFMVQINTVGEASNYFGLTFACSPFGEVLEQLPEGQEGVLVAELDLEEIRRARRQYGSIRDTHRSDLGLQDR
ncbi:MAG: carbon-nitrogen hydrolase family protein [Trueperaceae bacterium]|nr:MAG: carbon-nitrogen hydrolase family protein [Trueperaceae bacterium]